MSSDRSHHRNQHTVQRAYLRRFANSDGKLWQYDKQTGIITDVAASRATGQPDFYTLQLADGEESLFWEMDLLANSVEAPANPSIERILSQPGVPISHEDRRAVALWIAMSALRTTRIRNVHNDATLEWIATRPDAPAGIREKLPQILAHNAEILKNYHLMTVRNMFDQMTREIYTRGWGIVRFQERELLTCDNPVANYHEDFTGQPRGDDEPLFVVPLSPLVGILVSGRYFEDYEIPPDEEIALWFNRKVTRTADRYVFHSADDAKQRYFKELTPEERRAHFKQQPPPA